MPFNIGPGELLLILAIALLVIGPGRLPDVGAALGKSLREFRKATQEVQEAVSVQPRPNELRAPAQPTAPAAAPAAPAPEPAAEAVADETAAASDEPAPRA
jgi:TatA/E family protein of Tat protein translocase